MTSLAEALRDRSKEDRPGCTFEDRTTPWSRIAKESAVRAALLDELSGSRGPRRVTILRRNTPEYIYWIGASVLSGACIVALDPELVDPREPHLLRSLGCQIIVTDSTIPLRFTDSRDSSPEMHILDIDSAWYLQLLDRHSEADALSARLDHDSTRVSFVTSDTNGLISERTMTSERVFEAAGHANEGRSLDARDSIYLPVPLHRELGFISGWASALVTGAELIFHRTHTSGRFATDIHEYNCSTFVFDGATLDDVLAQERSDVESDNVLRIGFGTGSDENSRAVFRQRFGCDLLDADPWLRSLSEN